MVVNGLAAKVTIAGAEGDKDSLVIDGLAGNDSINASALNPGQINLTINGGAGNDTITGSRGNDVVIGGTGNDVALLGAGDDTFIWNPGDASDKIEGQVGTDTLRFNGANIDEKIDISANGSRARSAALDRTPSTAEPATTSSFKTADPAPTSSPRPMAHTPRLSRCLGSSWHRAWSRRAMRTVRRRSPISRRTSSRC